MGSIILGEPSRCCIFTQLLSFDHMNIINYSQILTAVETQLVERQLAEFRRFWLTAVTAFNKSWTITTSSTWHLHLHHNCALMRVSRSLLAFLLTHGRCQQHPPSALQGASFPADHLAISVPARQFCRVWRLAASQPRSCPSMWLNLCASSNRERKVGRRVVGQW